MLVLHCLCQLHFSLSVKCTDFLRNLFVKTFGMCSEESEGKVDVSLKLTVSYIIMYN